jgi:AcrR family transcriptional regulator
MDENTPDAKERIMNTVVGLMLEGKDISKVTNRDIAAQAGVNSALINYYYQSKENLLNQAVGLCMARMAGTLLDRKYQKENSATEAPLNRLKNMLRGISQFALEHRFLSEISINGELKGGNENTVGAILPLLKEITGGKKTELELKLLALQIIVPLQVMLLNAAAYQKILGVDLGDTATELRLLDTLVDNVIINK